VYTFEHVSRSSLEQTFVMADEAKTVVVTEGVVETCTACQKRGTDLLTCSRCKIAKYCGKECQKAHWKHGHKTT
jgi:hypothetical protein